MDSYSFYKSLYDRELIRRIHLDSAVNIPITILTLLGAIYFYITKEIYSILNIICLDIFSFLSILFIIATFITILISVIYLIASFNNYFKGFSYPNLGKTRAIRMYELNDLPNYNKEKGKEVKFESVIIDKLTSITDKFTYYNDIRGNLLHKSKTFSIISMILILFLLLFLTFKHI